ncbi:MAG: hypothetical protein LUO89_02240, partial [Methanothrix sp.]|nr:hypothetical protein [Methanothrix sp.]
MISTVTYYELMLATSAIILAAIALFSWQRRSAKGAVSFSILMLAVAFWSICNLLEIASFDIGDKIFWARMAFFGIVLVPVSWLAFTLQYTARDRWLTPLNLALLSIEPFLVLLLVWTNESYGLMWSEMELAQRGPFLELDV